MVAFLRGDAFFFIGLLYGTISFPFGILWAKSQETHGVLQYDLSKDQLNGRDGECNCHTHCYCNGPINRTN